MKSRKWTFTIAASAACLGPASRAPGDFLVVRIDPTPLGGVSAEARDINNLGQVVGTYLTAGGALRTFIWQGNIADIDPGHQAPITGYAINDSGTIAGETRDGDGDVVAFRRPAEGSVAHLTVFPAQCDNGGFQSTARDLSPHGAMAGQACTICCGNSAVRRAFLRQGEIGQTLGASGGPYSLGHALNDFHEVVGWTDTLFGTRPFFWSPDQGMVLLSADANGEGLDINRDGLAVGWRNVNIGGGLIVPRARLWQVVNGQPQATVLGVLPGNVGGRANGINRYGQVVGRSYGGTAGSRAFLWENGELTDLNELLPPGSGWVLEDAGAINDAGEIVGSGTLDGAPAVFLLSPALIPVVNDDCADAMVIDGNSFHPPRLNTAYATTEPAEGGQACGGAGSHSVWFEFTAEQSGLVTIDTQGSDYDTVLAVYDSYCGAGAPAIACNNNAGPGLAHSRIDNLYLGAGVLYMIRVSGNGGPGGMLDFNFSFAPSARLPAGRWTVISHGAWGGDLGAYPGGNPWLLDLGKDLDDLDPGSVRIHMMDRDTFAMLDDLGNPATPEDIADPSLHHVLLWDWSVNSFFIFGPDGYNDGFAYAAGDALYAFLRYHGIHDRVDYFIGHSRGAVVVSETTRRMILDGIDPVQVIYLDGEGGDFLSSGYEDDRFDAWASSSGVEIRYDSIFSTTYEGASCYAGFNLGGPECGAAGCGSRLFTYDLGTTYRHGHCGAQGSPPPIWEYLIEVHSTLRDGRGLYFDGQRYVIGDPPTATPFLPPVSAGDWDGHPADRTLFNGDFEWGSVAGWLSHGGGGHGHVDSLFEPSDHLELDDGTDDAWRDSSYFWLRQEWASLQFRYRVWDQDASFCNDSFLVTLTRCDDGNCLTGQDQTWYVTNRCAETPWRVFTVAVPAAYRGALCRIRFWQDLGPDGDVDSSMHIDDVRFLVSADLDGDGTVGTGDFASLLNSWGPCAACGSCAADLDGDCAVGVSDLLYLLERWP